MHPPNIGKKARLVSSQLCSTGFIYYKLNFRYVIACASDQCRLSVILRSDFNASEQVLWESTERTDRQGYRNDTIQPEAGDFTIIFQAEKVGNYDRSHYISIDNISFKPAGSVTTITPSTSTAAHPTTQTTTKAFTSTTMVAQRTDKQTTALTEQTSSKHVSSFGGTSLQTSPTWAGDSDTQKENDGRDSDARVIVGVAVSVIVVIVVVAAAIVILIFMRRRAKKPYECSAFTCVLSFKSESTAVIDGPVIGWVESSGSPLLFRTGLAETLPNCTYDQLRPPKERTDSRQYETLQVSGLQTTVPSQAESPYQNTAGNREYVNL
ncbi:hypothetical protein BaRGS_00037710 [Batillaria attramentaria]|uniref:Uncharacterized protein n=1 Tax=Batillaria attramentaria TaxID=370345 RepID=A0ABD0J8E3_9CAEN